MLNLNICIVITEKKTVYSLYPSDVMISDPELLVNAVGLLGLVFPYLLVWYPGIHLFIITRRELFRPLPFQFSPPSFLF
jgi:hypothetical protein